MYSWGKLKPQKVNNAVNVHQSIFDIALVLLTIKNMLESWEIWHRPDIVDNVLVAMIFGLFIWKFSLQRYTYKQTILVFILGVLCTYTCFHMNYFFILFSYVCVFGVQHVNLEQTIKKVAITKSTFLLTNIFIFFICYFAAPYLLTTIYRKGVMRYSLFQSHPNTFSMYLLWNTFEWLYVLYDRLKPLHIVGLWGINVFFYIFTNSNTAIIISTIVFLIVMIEKTSYFDLLWLVRWGAKWSFSLMAIFFTLITAFYTSMSGKVLSAYEWLNRAFTGRLRYGAFAYDVYGPTILGNNRWYDKLTYWRGFWIENVVFDNAYIWLLVYCGAIYMVIIAIAFQWVSRRAIRKELVLIIAYGFYAVMENYIANAAICFPLIFVGVYLFKGKSVEIHEGIELEDG